MTDDGSGRTYLEWMFEAWRWTLAVAGCSWLVAVGLGGLVGTLRTLPNSPWLVRLANVWVEFFRNIPLLVQIFLWYHVLPALFKEHKIEVLDNPNTLEMVTADGNNRVKITQGNGILIECPGQTITMNADTYVLNATSQFTINTPSFDLNEA